MPGDLSSVEHRALDQLQNADRAIATAELKEGCGLQKKSVDKLKEAGYVASRKVRNPKTNRGSVDGLEITKAGSAWLVANGPPPVDPYEPAECSALLVLMSENRTLSVNDLKDQYGIDLKKKSRDRLQRERLIEVSRTSPVMLELTDAGWDWVARQAESGDPAPKGLAPLYSLLRGVHRFLEVNHLAIGQVFGGEVLQVAAQGSAPTDDVEGLIREAYRGLARSKEDFVSLADLRDRLPTVPRKAVDDALVRMFFQDATHLRPNENVGSLTARDRAASLRLGEKDRHLIRVR